MLSDKKYGEKNSTAKVQDDFKKVYFFLYNLSQFIGFLYVFAVLNLLYAKDGSIFMVKAYSVVRIPLIFCQCLQTLEILHPLFGYTSGNAVQPFMQISARLIILVGIINSEPRIQSKPVVFYLAYVIALSEVIRYPYYILRICKVNIGFFTWLRYSAWIVLYPLGFLCQGIIIFRYISYFEETGQFSIFLPNKWNISFYFPIAIYLYYSCGLFPFVCFIMVYMYHQRKKILGSRK